jgi:transaldolase
MKIWVETTDIPLIEKGAAAGLLDGVVTTPSHLTQAGSPRVALAGLLEAYAGPVVVDVYSDFERMGALLMTLSPHIVVRIPAIEAAWGAIHMLAKNKVKVMAGAIFSPTHALFAARAGAAFVSPHLSRMIKTGERPFEQIESIQKIIINYQLPSQVTVLHPKSAEQVKACAEIGVAGVIVRDDLYKELLESHELAAFHTEQSDAEWKKFVEFFSPN